MRHTACCTPHTARDVQAASGRRWCYPVDMARVNEFGQSGEADGASGEPSSEKSSKVSAPSAPLKDLTAKKDN